MKKRVWMLTIAAAAVLALGGCSGSGDSQEAQSGAAETTSQAKESDSQETSGGSGVNNRKQLFELCLPELRIDRIFLGVEKERSAGFFSFPILYFLQHTNWII